MVTASEVYKITSNLVIIKGNQREEEMGLGVASCFQKTLIKWIQNGQHSKKIPLTVILRK